MNSAYYFTRRQAPWQWDIIRDIASQAGVEIEVVGPWMPGLSVDNFKANAEFLKDRPVICDFPAVAGLAIAINESFETAVHVAQASACPWLYCTNPRDLENPDWQNLKVSGAIDHPTVTLDSEPAIPKGPVVIFAPVRHPWDAATVRILVRHYLEVLAGEGTPRDAVTVVIDDGLDNLVAEEASFKCVPACKMVFQSIAYYSRLFITLGDEHDAEVSWLASLSRGEGPMVLAEGLLDGNGGDARRNAILDIVSSHAAMEDRSYANLKRRLLADDLLACDRAVNSPGELASQRGGVAGIHCLTSYTDLLWMAASPRRADHSGLYRARMDARGEMVDLLGRWSRVVFADRAPRM